MPLSGLGRSWTLGQCYGGRGCPSPESLEFGSKLADHVGHPEGAHLDASADAGVAKVGMVGRQLSVADNSARSCCDEVGESEPGVTRARAVDDSKAERVG